MRLCPDPSTELLAVLGPHLCQGRVQTGCAPGPRPARPVGSRFASPVSVQPKGPFGGVLGLWPVACPQGL